MCETWRKGRIDAVACRIYGRHIHVMAALLHIRYPDQVEPFVVEFMAAKKTHYGRASSDAQSSKHACPLELRCGQGLLQLNYSWEARTQRLSRAATLVGHSLWRCSVGRRKTGHVVEMCCDKEAAASEEAVTRQDEDEEGFKGQNFAAIGNAGLAMVRGSARQGKGKAEGRGVP